MTEKIAKSKKNSEETTVEVAKNRTASSYPAFQTNPFIDKTVIKTRTKRLTVARGSTIIDMNTGELEGVTEVAQIFKVDEAQFIKVFTSHIASFFELGQGAYRLMQIVFIITQQIQPHTDRIYMNPETLPKGLPKISSSSFYRALAELLEKDFLAKVESDTHWYFINPSLFFNGDRVRFITEYRKEEAKASIHGRQKQQEQEQQASLDLSTPLQEPQP